uniref:Uncharacterized protein n=1 Tax=Yersinia enterocolitica TaxID=630 RepID=B0RKV0_YEREN|nr:hypothetical protein [Yersinia enterocolitica]
MRLGSQKEVLRPIIGSAAPLQTQTGLWLFEGFSSPPTTCTPAIRMGKIQLQLISVIGFINDDLQVACAGETKKSITEPTTDHASFLPLKSSRALSLAFSTCCLENS